MPDDNGIPIPPGQENQGNTILAIDLAFFTISTIFVVLRVGTRLWITRNFGWDDAAIVLAQLLTVVGKIFVIEEVSNGLGQHMAAVNGATYSKFLMFNYVDWAQTMLALAVSKISICLFLFRLSQFSRLKNVLYALIALIVVSHLPLFFAYVFQCSPLYSNWDVDRPGCFSKDAVEAIIIVQGGKFQRLFSILIDLICAAFPAVLLRNTNLRTGNKIALSVLLGLGLITAVVCIVRTAFSWQVISEDLSWTETPNALARIIEVNLGITLACAPVMKPFVQYMNASVTGKDPHRLLSRGKNKPSMEHVQWHSGFRITPPAPKRQTGPRKPREIPAAAYKMSYHAAQQFDPPSIVLPIQRWDSDPRSSHDEEARLKEMKPLGSHVPNGEDLWEMDDSLERQMRAAVEHHKM